MRSSCLLALCSLALTGCVPYVFALPPVDLAADLGVRGPPAKVEPQVNLNVGVRPLALLPELHHRLDDFALGYTVTVTPSLVHGPYVEYTRVLLGEATGDTRLWRLRGGGVARLLYDTSAQRFGAQGGARLVIESSWLIDADFERSDGNGWVAGHALGELGFGAYVELGALVLPSSVTWVASLGLIATLPASAGVGFVWWR